MKNNYIIIGDSIVYGIGGYEQNGWPSMLKNKLLNQEGTKESTNYVHCVGFPGATSRDILNKISSIFNTYYSDDKNNYFIISIGVNDTQIFKKNNKVNLLEYENDITKIIKFFNNKEKCQVIFLGLTEIKKRNSPFLWKPDKYYDNNTIINYDNTLQKLCNNNNLKYISMRNVLSDDDYIDGLHPNDSGYNKILKEILLHLF